VWGIQTPAFTLAIKGYVVAMKRHKTDYAGVYYIIGTGARGTERIYYIRYRRNGKLIEEKAGRQFQNDMTPARAAGLRAQRIDGKEATNEERRESMRRAKNEAAGRWTIDKLWSDYKEGRPDMKGVSTDDYRYKKHLKELFGDKEPGAIDKDVVGRFSKNLGKDRKPQTVKHVLNLLDRIVNYGIKENIIAQGLMFKIKKPKVQNIKTEDLTDDQVRALLEAIENDDNKEVGAMLKLALFSGMRRGEIFKLRWKDVDFQRGFITIKEPKGGKEATIPMNQRARQVLEGINKSKSSFVFPGDDGKQRKTVARQAQRIREAAELPKDFRPFHGLRHVYASMIASSGQVDMFMLQKLLTHKSPIMTQRYSHLRDEALQRAAGVAGDLFEGIMKGGEDNKK
jgi:integrase